MKLGYNTNGLANHRWIDALELIAEVGFECVAITVDHYWLDPFAAGFSQQVRETRQHLERLGLSCVIETGARFLLNPGQKHEPTLMTPGAAADRRIDFLQRCIDLATELDAESVSFWSGICRARISIDMGFRMLADRCQRVLEYADDKQVVLAFEPEPGMFIESFEQFARLDQMIGAEHFGLTVDIGHVQCVEDGSISDHLRRWAPRIRNVHIEDMVRGVHEHLRFGEGEIDFDPVLATMQDIGYAGPMNVELSRHSHMAPTVVRESYDFLAGKLGR